MGEVINLRRARKARGRAQAEQAASQTRARHGQTLEQRASTRSEFARLERTIDAHRRERDPAQIQPEDPEGPSTDA